MGGGCHSLVAHKGPAGILDPLCDGLSHLDNYPDEKLDKKDPGPPFNLGK